MTRPETSLEAAGRKSAGHFSPRIKALVLFFVFAAASINFAVLLYHIDAYTMQIPMDDEWGHMDPLIKKMNDPSAPGEYARWIGNHRSPVVTYLRMQIALHMGWDRLFESRLSFGAVFFSFFCWLLLLKGTGTALGRFEKALAAGALFLCVFSARGFIVWIMPEMLVRTIPAAAGAAGILLLARPAFSWKAFFFSFACGLIVLGSFASGLAYGPALAPLLASRRFPAVRVKWAALALWLSGWAAVFFVYLQGFTVYFPLDYVKQIPEIAVKTPLYFLNYWIAYPGGLVVPYDLKGAAHPLTMWAGPETLLLWLFLGIYLFRKPHLRQTAAVFMTPGLYGFLTGALAAAGRAHHGIWHAVNPQYVIFSTLIWITVFLFAALAISELRRAGRRKSAAGVLSVFLLCFAAAAWVSFGSFPNLRSEGMRAKNLAAEMLQPGYADGKARWFYSRFLFLKQHRLTIFRSDEIRKAYAGI